MRPGSFGALMALYEANFIKLSALIPDVTHLSGPHLSDSTEDCDLFFGITGRTRYTCEFELSYLFPEADGTVVADPGLHAKAYFDARMIEVLHWSPDHRHDALVSISRIASAALEQRWALNIMFSKWLDYLLDQGHSFSAQS
ncbi:MAG: DUF1249 domain-containing protein [Gammaproteobacteria bacterium]